MAGSVRPALRRRWGADDVRGLGRWLKDVMHGFRRCRRAVTAVEVALVMPMFAFTCFAVIETAILYFVATTLEGRIAEASRQIRTGNVQGAEDPLTAFREILCGETGSLVACDDVVLDVRSFGDFASVDYPGYVDEAGAAENAQFQPGGPGDVVLVRATYRWRIITPFLAYALADSGNIKYLSALAVFRNEPYAGPIG